MVNKQAPAVGWERLLRPGSEVSNPALRPLSQEHFMPTNSSSAAAPDTDYDTFQLQPSLGGGDTYIAKNLYVAPYWDYGIIVVNATGANVRLQQYLSPMETVDQAGNEQYDFGPILTLPQNTRQLLSKPAGLFLPYWGIRFTPSPATTGFVHIIAYYQHQPRERR